MMLRNTRCFAAGGCRVMLGLPVLAFMVVIGDAACSSEDGQDAPVGEAEPNAAGSHEHEQAETPPSAGDEAAETRWLSYRQRFAIIVMGGSVPPNSRHYGWYWNDTFKMYNQLKDLGFTDENIRFLSYGPNAREHDTAVDATSTVDNIRAAYQWAARVCTKDDLLYIYWVDHGNQSSFEAHGELLGHHELGKLTAPIRARQIVGAFNPCFSGAVIDDLSRKGVITITSQDARHGNSWGWAGKWRQALRGGSEDDPSDANGDGEVTFAEAYRWIAVKSQAAGEHSMYDDNGDGTGSECGSAGFNPENPERDGCVGAHCSLRAWRPWPARE